MSRIPSAAISVHARKTENHSPDVAVLRVEKVAREWRRSQQRYVGLSEMATQMGEGRHDGSPDSAARVDNENDVVGDEEHSKPTELQPENAANEAEDDTLSPEMVSLELVLKTGCFEGFEAKRMTFLYTTQLTCSNVMSTVVTARPIDTSSKRRHRLAQQTSSNQNESSQAVNPTMHVYAQSCNPKKIKKMNGKYQTQLPFFRRSLPALPIPVHRLNQELVQERDRFMKQLHKEREEKRKLDNWAATKIQACYRGYRCRPRVITYEIRKRLNTLSSIRVDLNTMESTLKQLPPAIVESGEDGHEQSSPWRQEIASRAGKKHEFRAMKEQRHYATTLIQAVVRGFLARAAYAKMLTKHYDAIYNAAAIKLQSCFRAYRLRAKISTVVAKLQCQAAVQIQSLIRGVQARERALTRRFEHKCEQLRREGLPLQFSLPQRTHEIVHTSCLRPLYEHRKTALQLAFKSPLWHEERMYLQIYKVAIKLNVQRQWLLRLIVVTPPARRRKPKKATLSRQPSRLQARLGGDHQLLANELLASPTNSRRRRRSQTPGSESPTSSRPASPSNARAL